MNKEPSFIDEISSSVGLLTFIMISAFEISEVLLKISAPFTL